MIEFKLDLDFPKNECKIDKCVFSIFYLSFLCCVVNWCS